MDKKKEKGRRPVRKEGQGQKGHSSANCTGPGTAQGGPERLMTCPYNEKHQVGSGTFALHLMECRRAAPPDVQDRIKICKYNAAHHVEKSMYKDHLTICEDHKNHKDWRANISFLPRLE